jgi:hypothetical protein
VAPTDAAPARPPGRYGELRGPRRTAALAGLGVLAAVLLGYVMWVAWHHATPEVRAGLLSYDNGDPRSVSVVLEVVRPVGTPVTCEVRAQNVDDVTVGTARVAVPPESSPDRQLVTVVVPTSEQAVNGELVRCAASG